MKPKTTEVIVKYEPKTGCWIAVVKHDGRTYKGDLWSSRGRALAQAAKILGGLAVLP